VDKARLTVIIPSKGLEDLLTECLTALSVALSTVCDRVDAHVLLFDNGSEQPYRHEQFPEVNEIIRFDQGRSFSEVCSAGARARPSDLLLLLNNDVFLHPEALVEMLDLIQLDSVGVVGTRLLFADRTIQHAGVVMTRHGPAHDFRLRRTETVSRAPRFCPAVTGAAMMIRSDLYRRLGGLLEDYNFGYEDIDFCLRVRQAGFRIACAQKVDSIHLESQTPERIVLDRTARMLFKEQWDDRYSVDLLL